MKHSSLDFLYGVLVFIFTFFKIKLSLMIQVLFKLGLVAYDMYIMATWGETVFRFKATLLTMALHLF